MISYKNLISICSLQLQNFLKNIWLFTLLFSLQSVLAQGDASRGLDRFEAFKVLKYFTDASTKFDAGEYKEAIIDYNTVLELNPNHERVYEARGNAYFELGDFNNAKGDYSKAIRQHPQNANLFNYRGETYEELGYYSSALRDYNRALKINPDYQEAQKNKDELEEKMRLVEAKNKRDDPVRVDDWRNNWKNGEWRDDNWEKDNNWKDNGWETTDWDKVDRDYDRYERNNNIFNKSKTYNRPNLAANPNKYVTIERIIVTDNSTEVTFKIDSPLGKVVSFRVHRPGTKGAFFISDRAFRRKYKLKSQKGFIAWDREISVYGGRSQTFTLSFDKIPNKHRYIHILEGDNKSSDAWNFYDIELRNQ